MSTSKKLQVKAEKAMTNGSFLKAIEILGDLLKVHPDEKNYLLMRHYYQTQNCVCLDQFLQNFFK